MVKSAILEIYKQTYSFIEESFSPNCEKMLLLYKEYLNNRYEGQLSQLYREKSEEEVRDYIDSFIDDERRLWTGLSKEEIIANLDKDIAYEHLSLLSSLAFEQAKECYLKNKYYNNENEYMARLEDLADCLDQIKPHNIDAAKELLSEAILDIDFIFGKSEIMSLS